MGNVIEGKTEGRLADGHRARENFFERHQSFGTRHAERLNLILEEMEQMLVVLRNEFDKNVVATCSEMAFDDFGNLFQLFDDVGKLGGFSEIKANIGASLIAHRRRFDQTLPSRNDSGSEQFLDTLMYGSA